MSIAQRLKAAFRGETLHPRPASRWSIPRTKFNYAKEVGDGLSSSVVMAVVLWLMRNFPEAPVILEKDEEPEPNHDMARLVRRPNQHYSGVVLMMATILSFVTAGNAYWVKERDSMLRVIGLWWIPHWLMKPAVESGSHRYVDQYVYTVDGQKYYYDIDDVVHFRFGLDPYDTRVGLSPLMTLLREIFTDDEASNWTAAICKNAGIPGVLISPKEGGIIGDQDVKAVKDYVKDKFSGDHRGEPMALSGPTNVDQFGFNPQEMNLEAIRAIPETRVAAALGVPAAVIGFMAGLKQTKVGATMRELREQAYEGGIIPIQRMLSEDLWSQLLPDFEPQPDLWNVAFDLTKVRVLQEDENKRAERTAALYAGGILYLDEARQAEGFETNPAERVRRVPFSVTEIPEGEMQAQPEPVEEEDPEDDEPDEDIEDIETRAREHKAAKPDWYPKLLASHRRDVDKLNGVYEPALIKRFDAMGKAVADIYGEVMLENSLAGKTKSLEDLVIGELTIDRAQSQLVADHVLGYDTLYLQTASLTVESLNAVLNLGVMLTDSMEQTVLAAAGKRQGLIDLTAQSKTALFKALEEGRELGEGPDLLMTRIEHQVAAGPWSSSKIRAEVIARTETKFAQNIASLESYKQADTIGAVQVYDALLGETDDFCMSIDGAIVSFAEADALAVSEHPNGTRDFGPVFGEPASYDTIPRPEGEE